MEFASALRRLWKLRFATALGIIAAAAAGIFTAYDVSFSRPSLTPKPLAATTATGQMLIDSPVDELADITAYMYPNTRRAQLGALFFASEATRAQIAAELGVPPHAVTVVGTPAFVQLASGVTREPTAEERANELATETNTMSVVLAPELEQPVIDVTASAPTAQQAVRLVRATIAVAQRQVLRHGGVPRFGPATKLVLRPLDRPSVQAASSSVGNATMAFVIGIGAFIVWCILLLGFQRLVRRWRQTQTAPSTSVPATSSLDERVLEAERELSPR